MQVPVPSIKSRSFWPQSPCPNPCVPIECSSVFRWRPAQGRGLTWGPVVSDGSGNWDPGLMTPIFRLADLLLLFVLLYCFFFLGLGKKKKMLHPCQSRRKIRRQKRQGGPGVIYVKSYYRPDILWGFLLFFLQVWKQAPLVPFYRWPTSDSQSCVSFPESNIYPLPSAQAKRQPPLWMMDFQGLRTDSGKLPWYGNWVVSCPHLAWRWRWGWNPAPWVMSQEAWVWGCHIDWLIPGVSKWTQKAAQTLALGKGNLSGRISTWATTIWKVFYSSAH